MSLCYIPIESFQTKLYQKENRSKRFAELTEERLSEIAKHIYKRKEFLSDKDRGTNSDADKLDNYVWTLRYLTDSCIHLQYPEYDEKIAYLIMSVDPELLAFKEYLKISMPSIGKIQSEKHSIRKQQLLQDRNRAVGQLQKSIREKLGFYDAKLLKFEELFFRRFYGSKELITDVNQEKYDDFSVLTLLANSFDTISEARYRKLLEKADIWLSLVDSSKHRSKIAMYSVLKQKDLIGLMSREEQVLFYILVADPDLEMLKIYEDESRIPVVKNKITEKFGFYNLALINYERQYYTRFCPDKDVSVWLKK